MADVPSDLDPRAAWLTYIVADPNWTTKEWPAENEPRFAAFLDKQVNGAAYAAKSDAQKQLQAGQEPYRLICNATFAKKKPGLWVDALTALRASEPPCIVAIPDDVALAVTAIDNNIAGSLTFTANDLKSKSALHKIISDKCAQQGATEATAVLKKIADYNAATNAADQGTAATAVTSALQTLDATSFIPSQTDTFVPIKKDELVTALHTSLNAHAANVELVHTFATNAKNALELKDSVGQGTWAAVSSKVLAIPSMKKIPACIDKAYNELQLVGELEQGSKFYSAVEKLDTVIAAAKHAVTLDMLSVDHVLKLASVYEWFKCNKMYGTDLATTTIAAEPFVNDAWKITGTAFSGAIIDGADFDKAYAQIEGAFGTEDVDELHEQIRAVYDLNLLNGNGKFYEVNSGKLPLGKGEDLTDGDAYAKAAKVCALKAIVCWGRPAKGTPYTPKYAKKYAQWAVTFAHVVQDKPLMTEIVDFVTQGHTYLQANNADPRLFARTLQLDSAYGARLVRRRNADVTAKVKQANADADARTNAEEARKAEDLSLRLRIATTDAIGDENITDAEAFTTKVAEMLDTPQKIDPVKLKRLEEENSTDSAKIKFIEKQTETAKAAQRLTAMGVGPVLDSETTALNSVAYLLQQPESDSDYDTAEGIKKTSPLVFYTEAVRLNQAALSATDNDVCEKSRAMSLRCAKYHCGPITSGGDAKTAWCHTLVAYHTELDAILEVLAIDETGAGQFADFKPNKKGNTFNVAMLTTNDASKRIFKELQQLRIPHLVAAAHDGSAIAQKWLSVVNYAAGYACNQVYMYCINKDRLKKDANSVPIEGDYDKPFPEMWGDALEVFTRKATEATIKEHGKASRFIGKFKSWFRTDTSISDNDQKVKEQKQERWEAFAEGMRTLAEDYVASAIDSFDTVTLPELDAALSIVGSTTETTTKVATSEYVWADISQAPTVSATTGLQQTTQEKINYLFKNKYVSTKDLDGKDAYEEHHGNYVTKTTHKRIHHATKLVLLDNNGAKIDKASGVDASENTNAVSLFETPPNSTNEGKWSKEPTITASQFRPSLEHKWKALLESGLAYRGGAKHNGADVTVSQFEMHIAQNHTDATKWEFKDLRVEDAVFGGDRVLEKNAPFDEPKNMLVYKTQRPKCPSISTLVREGAIQKPQKIADDPTKIAASITSTKDFPSGIFWGTAYCDIEMATTDTSVLKADSSYILEWTRNIDSKKHRTVVPAKNTVLDVDGKTFTMSLGNIQAGDVDTGKGAEVLNVGAKTSNALPITMLAVPVKWDPKITELFDNTVSDDVTNAIAAWCNATSHLWVIPYVVFKWKEVLDATCAEAEITKWTAASTAYDKASKEGKKAIQTAPTGNKYDGYGGSAKTRVRLLELAAKQLPAGTETLFLEFTDQMETASATFSQSARTALSNLLKKVHDNATLTKCLPPALDSSSLVADVTAGYNYTSYTNAIAISNPEDDIDNEFTRVCCMLQRAVLYNTDGAMFEGADQLMAVTRAANLVFPTDQTPPISYDNLEEELEMYAERGQFKDPYVWLMQLFSKTEVKKQMYAYKYLVSPHNSFYGAEANTLLHIQAKNACGYKLSQGNDVENLYKNLESSQNNLRNLLQNGPPSTYKYVKQTTWWLLGATDPVRKAFVSLIKLKGSEVYAAARRATLIEALSKVICPWDDMSLDNVCEKKLFFNPDATECDDDYATLRQFLIDRYVELWRRGNWVEVGNSGVGAGNEPGFLYGLMWPKERDRLQELTTMYKARKEATDPEIAYIATMIMASRKQWDNTLKIPETWVEAALSTFAKAARGVPPLSELYAEAQCYIMMYEHSAGNIATSKRINGITAWLNAHGTHYAPGTELETLRNNLVTQLEEEKEQRDAQRLLPVEICAEFLGDDRRRMREITGYTDDELDRTEWPHETRVPEETYIGALAASGVAAFVDFTVQAQAQLVMSYISSKFRTKKYPVKSSKTPWDHYKKESGKYVSECGNLCGFYVWAISTELPNTVQGPLGLCVQHLNAYSHLPIQSYIAMVQRTVPTLDAATWNATNGIVAYWSDWLQLYIDAETKDIPEWKWMVDINIGSKTNWLNASSIASAKNNKRVSVRSVVFMGQLSKLVGLQTYGPINTTALFKGLTSKSVVTLCTNHSTAVAAMVHSLVSATNADTYATTLHALARLWVGKHNMRPAPDTLTLSTRTLTASVMNAPAFPFGPVPKESALALMDQTWTYDWEMYGAHPAGPRVSTVVRSYDSKSKNKTLLHLTQLVDDQPYITVLLNKNTLEESSPTAIVTVSFHHLRGPPIKDKGRTTGTLAYVSPFHVRLRDMDATVSMPFAVESNFSVFPASSRVAPTGRQFTLPTQRIQFTGSKDVSKNKDVVVPISNTVAPLTAKADAYATFKAKINTYIANSSATYAPDSSPAWGVLLPAEPAIIVGDATDPAIYLPGSLYDLTVSAELGTYSEPVGLDFKYRDRLAELNGLSATSPDHRAKADALYQDIIDTNPAEIKKYADVTIVDNDYYEYTVLPADGSDAYTAWFSDQLTKTPSKNIAHTAATGILNDNTQSSFCQGTKFTIDTALRTAERLDGANIVIDTFYLDSIEKYLAEYEVGFYNKNGDAKYEVPALQAEDIVVQTTTNSLKQKEYNDGGNTYPACQLIFEHTQFMARKALTRPVVKPPNELEERVDAWLRTGYEDPLKEKIGDYIATLDALIEEEQFHIGWKAKVVAQARTCESLHRQRTHA